MPMVASWLTGMPSFPHLNRPNERVHGDMTLSLYVFPADDQPRQGASQVFPAIAVMPPLLHNGPISEDALSRVALT